MTTPRSCQIDLTATSYYHCISRCVRQSYLYGYDKEKKKDFSHRKQWILDRIKHLSNVFYINICAYSIMSNHYHLVLHVDQKSAKNTSFDDLLFRWHLIFPADAVKLKKLVDSSSGEQEKNIKRITKVLQHRLSNISWYMRCLNEVIAKMANKEDDCKGRFWEGRFKSQALLDEGALLSAMVYVDLNPIRAGVAATPEASDFTSIQERILHYAKNASRQPKDLMPFDSGKQNSSRETIEFGLKDYIELVDTTGRFIREDKRGAIPNSLGPIFERLQLTEQGWFEMVKGIESNFHYAVGHSVYLKEFLPYLQYRKSKCVDFVEMCYLELAA